MKEWISNPVLLSRDKYKIDSEYLHARLFTIFAVIAGKTWAIWSAVYFYLIPNFPVMIITGLASLSCFGLALMVKAGWSHKFCRVATVQLTSLALIVSTVFTGGVGSYPYAWLLVALIGGFLLFRRAGGIKFGVFLSISILTLYAVEEIYQLDTNAFLVSKDSTAYRLVTVFNFV
ncbi:MAG: hypothetical protein HRU19_27370 [Pseudobacteriovorax sp.]|nr:hypothetical protein [Pseudobacteriovorax sp.]